MRDLRKRQRGGPQAIQAGDLRLDPKRRSVSRGGEPIQLTPIEFDLLYELALHQGQVLSNQILTDRIWGYTGVYDSSLLKGHIRNLRRKLEPDPSRPTYLHTVTGVGYTLSGPAGPVSAPSYTTNAP